MVFRGINVRVMRQTGKYINYVLLSSNSKMRMSATDFMKNVEDGVYIVQNPDALIEG